MIKAKIIETGEEGFANEPNWGAVSFLFKDGTMKNIPIDKVQFLEQFNPNQLSKETQVQAILFEGQCILNGMIADNEQRKICNESMAYICDDFIGIQKEIQNRINELNKEN